MKKKEKTQLKLHLLIQFDKTHFLKLSYFYFFILRVYAEKTLTKNKSKRFFFFEKYAEFLQKFILS